MNEKMSKIQCNRILENIWKKTMMSKQTDLNTFIDKLEMIVKNLHSYSPSDLQQINNQIHGHYNLFDDVVDLFSSFSVRTHNRILKDIMRRTTINGRIKISGNTNYYISDFERAFIFNLEKNGIALNLFTIDDLKQVENQLHGSDNSFDYVLERFLTYMDINKISKTKQSEILTLETENQVCSLENKFHCAIERSLSF
jgi:hypothetical protein